MEHTFPIDQVIEQVHNVDNMLISREWLSQLK